MRQSLRDGNVGASVLTSAQGNHGRGLGKSAGLSLSAPPSGQHILYGNPWREAVDPLRSFASTDIGLVAAGPLNLNGASGTTFAPPTE